MPRSCPQILWEPQIERASKKKEKPGPAYEEEITGEIQESKEPGRKERKQKRDHKLVTV